MRLRDQAGLEQRRGKPLSGILNLTFGVGEPNKLDLHFITSVRRGFLFNVWRCLLCYSSCRQCCYCNVILRVSVPGTSSAVVIVQVWPESNCNESIDALHLASYWHCALLVFYNAINSSLYHKKTNTRSIQQQPRHLSNFMHSKNPSKTLQDCTEVHVSSFLKACT